MSCKCKWAIPLIEKLRSGECIKFKPKGSSMLPLIKSGQEVTICPASEYKVGDIVLCEIYSRVYLHLIKAIKNKPGGKYLIGNNRGGLNGWTDKIYGKYIKDN